MALVGASLLVAAPAMADESPVPSSDTRVIWDAGPCTEPVLMSPVDRENVRGHIPAEYPGTDDEFMSHLVTSPGPDGRPQATVVFTLNRCRDSEVTRVVNGTELEPTVATDVAEVLVMVLWDGPSSNQFEFYALASYVNTPELAGAFRALGLPSQATPELVYQLDAEPDQPDPGAEVPFVVEVPGAFRFEGTVVRPLEYGPAGHATHHHDGPRGAIWVEHDAPTGGIAQTGATVTVTGEEGAWLADLLGADTAFAAGLYLEKLVGHGHTAYLIE